MSQPPIVLHQMKCKISTKNIDDWRSHERYETAQHALSKTDTYSFELIKDILSGKYGFMCQYDRRTNADTVWSCIYDIKNKKIYRCEGNPSRKRFVEDKRLNLYRKNPVMQSLSIAGF